MSYLAQFDGSGQFIGVLSEHQALLNEEGPYTRIPLPQTFDPSKDTIEGTPDSFRVVRAQGVAQTAMERILQVYPPSRQIAIMTETIQRLLETTGVEAKAFSEMYAFIKGIDSE